MPSHNHSGINQPKPQGFRLSLICVAILGAIVGATAVSATETSMSRTGLYEQSSPRLADARSDNWKPHEGTYRDKSRERHQQPPRDRSNGRGTSRERYQAPPRQSSAPHHERERNPEPRRNTYQERERYQNEVRHYDRDRHDKWQEHDRDRYRHEPRYNPPPPRGKYFGGPYRPRHSRDIVVVRPFRYDYPRHHHHLHGDDIWGWLTFTAITLAILDNLNEQQQRAHEMALYSATAAPLGETIYWNKGDASGAITPIQDGNSSSGRYCREFQQQVDIGGQRESLYGTACQNPDGSWEIVQ